MAKEPVAGRAKTRLARDVGRDVAAELARAFLLDTLETVGGLVGRGVRVEVHFDPPEARGWFEQSAPPGVRTFEQERGDLGERMVAAFRSAFARGGTRCVMIGMDTPAVTRRTLAGALEVVEPGSIVLGPSSDGGYWAIGMSAFEERLFEDVAWSTDKVLAQTEARARYAGLQVTRLREECDVDTGADLTRLCAALRATNDVGRRSRAALLTHAPHLFGRPDRAGSPPSRE